MILLFAIVGHFINYEYSNTFSEHSQMIIYGLNPDYKNNFVYPTSCNQLQLIDINMCDINDILNVNWNIYNQNGKFDFWQTEYLNRYDYEEIYKNEFDFFVNYLIFKNKILNISNEYNDIVKKLYIKYGINIDLDIELNIYEEIENEKKINQIKNLDKIDKIKYDKIKFNYDINYLNNLFSSFETTLKFNNLYEIWICSI